jgi:hypothetical protein
MRWRIRVIDRGSDEKRLWHFAPQTDGRIGVGQAPRLRLRGGWQAERLPYN